MIASLILGFHLNSHHFGPNPGWKQNNQNLGIYAIIGDDLEIGVYENTLSRWSLYGAQTLLGDARKGPSLNIGLATGYHRKIMGSQKIPFSLPHDQGSGWRTKIHQAGFKTHIRPFAAVNYVFPAVLSVSPRVTLTRKLIHLSIQKDF